MDKNTDKFAYEKALHIRIREDARKASAGHLKLQHEGMKWESYISHREMLLLWGFVRGFKFRRIERSHRIENGEEFTGLSSGWLARVWRHYLPDLTDVSVQEWLDDPTGAIAAPPPREKRPYVAAAE